MRAVTTWLAIVLMLGPVQLAVAAPQRAQTRPERADAGEKQARVHFKKAERAFNLGKFAEALISYQAAFEAKPLPAFVFNIAQCHRNLDDPERALFFYRRYLALDPEGPHRKLVRGPDRGAAGQAGREGRGRGGGAHRRTRGRRDRAGRRVRRGRRGGRSPGPEPGGPPGRGRSGGRQLDPARRAAAAAVQALVGVGGRAGRWWRSPPPRC